MIEKNITLSTNMSEWTWYNDSMTVHLFLHLLLSASDKNATVCGIKIRKGQFLTSIGNIQHGMNGALSRQNLRSRLNKLQRSGAISQQTIGKKRIITICKYSNYESCNQYPTTSQPQANQKNNDITDCKPYRYEDEKETVNQYTTNIQPISNQKTENNRMQQKNNQYPTTSQPQANQKNNDITDCKPYRYEDEKETANQYTTNIQPQTNQKTTERKETKETKENKETKKSDIKENKETKENKENKEKRSLLLLKRACAREKGKNIESDFAVDDEIQLAESLKQSDMAVEAICMNAHISRQELDDLIDAFLIKMAAVGETHHNSPAEFRRHLVYWIDIQLQNKKEDGNTKQNDKRRGYEVTATTAEQYSTGF